jgi:phage tail-like protein
VLKNRMDDPFLSFRFRVAVDGRMTDAGFSDVGGLGAETDLETFRAGGVNGAEIVLAGPTKFTARLTLKRGLARGATLWKWYQDVLGGLMTRRQVTVELRDDTGKPAMQWVFSAALPVKWVGPELHAAQGAVAFESVELVHQGFVPGA